MKKLEIESVTNKEINIDSSWKNTYYEWKKTRFLKQVLNYSPGG